MKNDYKENKVLEAVDEKTTEAVDETMEEITEKPESSTVLGVVTECIKLRVRKTPEVGDNVICEIVFASEVLVDLNESTDDFYKITTGAGIEGYCMKQFINIGE